MTEIALLLTAIPLAVALAMFLNALLDRRLAAVTQTVRRTPGSKLSAWLACVALAALAASPAAAAHTDEASPADCATIDCSLEADAERIERLWSRAPEGAVLVAQSRLPVVVELSDDGSSDRWLAGETLPLRSNDLDRNRIRAEP